MRFLKSNRWTKQVATIEGVSTFQECKGTASGYKGQLLRMRGWESRPWALKWGWGKGIYR